MADLPADLARCRHSRFRIHSEEELGEYCRALEVRLPFSRDLSPLLAPLKVAGLTLRNRMVGQPMEGFDALPDGSPGPHSLRRYRRYATGGCGLVWIEATAVAPDGKSSSRQFHLHPENLRAYADLFAMIRASAREAGHPEPVIVLQLTHSGRYSKPGDQPAPAIARHYPPMDERQQIGPEYPLCPDERIDRLPGEFAAAAKLGREAGADVIDVKSCHGYLMAELFSAHTRPGRYGGSFENRTRAFLDMIRAVAAAVPGMPLFSRLGVADMIPYPHGFGVAKEDSRIFDPSEAIRLIGEMKKLGVSLFDLTIGNPYWNSFYGRPYDIPLPGQALPAEHPLVGVARCVAVTRMMQNAFPDTPMTLFGCGWLRHFFAPVAAGLIAEGGAMLAGQGRGMFAYPEWAADIASGKGMVPGKCCVTCSLCVRLKTRGKDVGCPVRDKDVYKL